jgi:hypothetical protein
MSFLCSKLLIHCHLNFEYQSLNPNGVHKKAK